MKLKTKERWASREEDYEARKLLISGCWPLPLWPKRQEKLKRQYKSLNPAALKRNLDRLRKRLFALAMQEAADPGKTFRQQT